MQFCPKNVGRTRVFIFEQTARNILHAICSKIKTRVLPTFLGQNCVFSSISNIFCPKSELNTQFCPKNIGRMSASIFEQMAHKIFVQK